MSYVLTARNGINKVDLYDGSTMSFFTVIDVSKLTASVSAYPIGTIMMYAKDTLPAGSNWQICDGTNGTPDMTSKFIIGSATPNPTAVGAHGNADTTLPVAHSHSGKTDEAGNHKHIFKPSNSYTSTNGNHRHYHAKSFRFGHAEGSTNHGVRGGGDVWMDIGTAFSDTNTTDNHHHTIRFPAGTSSENSHSHTATCSDAGTDSGNELNMPPYFGIKYIMKMV